MGARQSSAAGRNTMRAAVFRGPRAIEMQELALPEPSAGQVRIKLQGCGVCASNLSSWEGRPWFSYPLHGGAPGHEGWGVIDAVGKDVVGRSEGERVAMLSYNAYAEYDVAQADQLVTLPDTLADQPFPGEALACAMNIFRRADLRDGQTVAIVGIGFLGALLTRLASNAGARVIAISRRPFSLQIATRFGAQHTIAMQDHAAILEQAQALTRGKGCERVIEAVGQQWPLDLASEIVGERGRLIIAGYHQDGARQVNMQQWNWRGIDVINAHERDPAVYVAGMRDAIAAIERGELDPSPLYTHRFSLDELGAALAAISERPAGVLKALVTP